MSASLFEGHRLCGVDPQAYLSDVRSDQFVIILRVRHRHRRGDMQDVLRANGRLVPARVRLEIGFDELDIQCL